MNETGQYCVYTSYLAPERLRELKEFETVSLSGLEGQSVLIGALSVKLKLKMLSRSFFCQRSLSASWP
jgi:hypothetical protein